MGEVMEVGFIGGLLDFYNDNTPLGRMVSSANHEYTILLLTVSIDWISVDN